MISTNIIKYHRWYFDHVTEYERKKYHLWQYNPIDGKFCVPVYAANTPPIPCYKGGDAQIIVDNMVCTFKT